MRQPALLSSHSVSAAFPSHYAGPVPAFYPNHYAPAHPVMIRPNRYIPTHAQTSRLPPLVMPSQRAPMYSRARHHLPRPRVAPSVPRLPPFGPRITYLSDDEFEIDFNFNTDGFTQSMNSVHRCTCVDCRYANNHHECNCFYSRLNRYVPADELGHMPTQMQYDALMMLSDNNNFHNKPAELIPPGLLATIPDLYEPWLTEPSPEVAFVPIMRGEDKKMARLLF
jgi:hypothetical protein